LEKCHEKEGKIVKTIIDEINEKQTILDQKNQECSEVFHHLTDLTKTIDERLFEISKESYRMLKEQL
jgi:hypothetical protein